MIRSIDKGFELSSNFHLLVRGVMKLESSSCDEYVEGKNS